MNDYVNDPRALNIPWVLSPFFEASLATRDLTPDQVAMARGYREKGYHVLEDPVVDEAVLDRVVRDMQGRYTDTQTGYPHPSRKLDAWREVASVAEVARAQSVLEALALLYGRRPFPFQTLNFERGTQQRAHSDTIHFHSVPQRFMAGAWVALEDIHPDSGPILVYPGSHRLPVLDPLDLGFEATWDNHDRYEDAIGAVVEAAGLEPLSLSLRKGQAVIWAANLLHGGEAVRDPARTRLSQASHYFFDDCFYYQPAASDPFVGRLALKDVEDVGTGRKVPNLYRGRPVDEWLRGNRPLVTRLFGR